MTVINAFGFKSNIKFALQTKQWNESYGAIRREDFVIMVNSP